MFSADGTPIFTGSADGTAKVWDPRTGKELQGEAIPKTDRNERISPDGRLFARLDGDRVQFIPTKLDAEEIDYRLLHTRANPWRYQDGYDAARAAGDYFAARFYLDRLLSLPEHRTTARFQNRNALQADPLVIARTGFHHPVLATTPYDRGTVALLAASGDRLAQRLVAQELLRDGKPGAAVPLLFWCLASRPATSPPVEELLLARACLVLKQPDEAKRFYRAAAEWLDRPPDHRDALGVGFAPNGDPRRNPFDWEAWHECDVFRAVLRLPAVLRGEEKLKDNVERLTFARVAYDRKQFAGAARLWAEALASDPKVGDDRRAQHRCNAACAAARAAGGQGQDEPPLDAAAKGKFRGQALDWLKTELTVWAGHLEAATPQDLPAIQQTLRHWQQDPDLAGIHDAAALAELPAEEQKAFAQLWADLTALLKKSEEKPQ